MTDLEHVRRLQGRLALVVRDLKEIHGELLNLPAEVDTEAIPVIRRTLSDAKHHTSAGFYALGALADSVAHGEAQR